ncbi:MAG: hypothetical protein AB7S87_12880, partial [Burkholderiales bacterium]
AGAMGHGVIQGCAVAAQGSPDMTVAVAVGTVQVLGMRTRKVAAGNAAIGAADATNPRIDFVCVDATGTKQVVAGAAAAYPVMPAIPAGYVVLAAVYVPATDTAINANQIIDKRVILSPLMVAAPGCFRILEEFANGAQYATAATPTFKNDIFLGGVANVAGNQNAFGYAVFSTGASSASGRAGLITFDQLGRPGSGLIHAKAVITTDTALSDVTQRYAVHFGLIDLMTGNSVDGCYFRYTDNVNGGKWQCVCVANSVETVADSGVAYAVSTQYLLEIEVNSDGTQVTFFIGGSQVAQIATNIPTAAGRECGFGVNIFKSVGTTARAVAVDVIELLHLPLVPY